MTNAAEIAGIAPVLVEDDQNGIVRFTHAGRSITLHFDWGVIAEIQKDFGKRYQATIGEGIQARDVLILAKLISMGSGHAERREGHLSIAEVGKWSPPLITMTTAIETAWLLAMFGPTMQPEGSSEAKEGKPISAQRKTSFLLRFVQACVPGLRGKSFGVSPPTPPAA